MKALYKSILDDIDVTLKRGDDIFDKFELIKSSILDPNAYTKLTRSSYTILIKELEPFFNYIGIKNASSMWVSICKKSTYDSWDSHSTKWVLDIMVNTKNDAITIKKEYYAGNLSFIKFLKNKVEPLVKDINAFKSIFPNKVFNK